MVKTNQVLLRVFIKNSSPFASTPPQLPESNYFSLFLAICSDVYLNNYK